MSQGAKKLKLYSEIDSNTVFSSMGAAQKAMARLVKCFNITDEKVITVVREDTGKPWITAMIATNN